MLGPLEDDLSMPGGRSARRQGSLLRNIRVPGVANRGSCIFTDNEAPFEVFPGDPNNLRHVRTMVLVERAQGICTERLVGPECPTEICCREIRVIQTGVGCSRYGMLGEAKSAEGIALGIPRH